MKLFEEKFRASMKSSVPLLDRITHYIVKRKGKQIRPMFVFLSAKIFGEITESTHRGASLIELLHTATLVHDDVVDNAFERRGFFSINALWKNKIAVLVGDYLLSRGLLLAIRNKEFKQLEIVSTAVEEMSEGELLQIEKSRGVNLNEEIYFEIIRQKTATLIASCCACGAASAGCDDEMIERMRMIGEKIGVAFQIKDDLFDYGLGGKIGKPTGIDIKEKKSTLPLIYALNHSANGEKRAMLRIVKKDNKKKAEIDKVIQYVLDSGGIEYADQKMRALSSEARTEILKLPAGEARDSLLALVEFTINREK
ncbi:MAG: polyprenyl synthetase family protein [Flavobacteriales bacterium]|nr:polyprenyl synthetase family protein [Flavobacteriales bacterium]NCG30597.1 polyprenyl synthetase family protein [Bacteroidota bacterium]MBT3964295.1 polyprenyl synthetase family protein [Flavobacteriales bacterium]MBT4705571.1 polyprenyl synthetase family protein [Flavobacteriales bacterium]MBT4931110.1 polyprenyl synthetase family protein [Flavobacteriales bacterium]